MICKECSKDAATSDDEVEMIDKGIVDKVPAYSDGYYDYVYLYQCPKCKNVEIE